MGPEGLLALIFITGAAAGGAAVYLTRDAWRREMRRRALKRQPPPSFEDPEELRARLAAERELGDPPPKF